MPAVRLSGIDPVAVAGSWARARIADPPWGSGLGLARTVLALGTLGTLLATPPQVLFTPLENGMAPPFCTDVGRASAWCVMSAAPQLARWLSVGVLLAVVSGWRPRLTAIPHWWVCWSLVTSVSIGDGGDTITADLTLLLIPVLLADSRKWHWQRPDPAASGQLSRLVAVAALVLAQVQVACVYLIAGISKLGVPEWLDGTALFYISRSVTFGAPPWLSPVWLPVTSWPVGVAAITWGAVALEIALGLALLLPKQVRLVLLASGLLFHDLIALSMGLISFDCAMSGALLLYLLPIGYQVTAPKRLFQTRALPTSAKRQLARPVAATDPLPAFEPSATWPRARPGP